MNRISLFFLFLLCSLTAQAQIVPKETEKTDPTLIENDSILSDTILLPEIIISKQKLSLEDKKQFLILQNRVYKTYPYAKLASERLVALKKGMSYLKTNKEKKKYFIDRHSLFLLNSIVGSKKESNKGVFATIIQIKLAKTFSEDDAKLLTLLLKYFENILDFNFTANVEKEFDQIALGEMEWKKMISCVF